VRLDIRRIGAVKDRDEVVGNQTRVKVVKNKVAPPFKQVEFDIMYGEGVSKMGELIDLGVKAGIVEKSGAWFSYNSQRSGRGVRTPSSSCARIPEIADEIELAIRQNAGLIAERSSNRKAGWHEDGVIDSARRGGERDPAIRKPREFRAPGGPQRGLRVSRFALTALTRLIALPGWRAICGQTSVSRLAGSGLSGAFPALCRQGVDS
jgi:hypothetical protein